MAGLLCIGTLQNQSTSVVSHSASREHRARAAVSVLKSQACPTRSSERFSSVRYAFHTARLTHVMDCVFFLLHN